MTVADLDLRNKSKDDQFQLSPYSERWAEVVKPLTQVLFLLLAAVLLIPFLFVFVDDRSVQAAALDWAKTILAPVVGFASAAIGYYYGTRASGSNDGGTPPEDDG